MQGKSAGNAGLGGPRPVVFGRRRADAQSGLDAVWRRITVAAELAPRWGVGGADPRKMRFLALGIGKSVVIDLPRDVKDVLVADPKIANAVIRSPQRAYIIGAAVGQTNVVFFDAAANRSPPTTSRSNAISTACAPR